MGESPWKFESSRPHQKDIREHQSPPSGALSRRNGPILRADGMPNTASLARGFDGACVAPDGLADPILWSIHRQNAMLDRCRATGGAIGLVSTYAVRLERLRSDHLMMMFIRLALISAIISLGVVHTPASANRSLCGTEYTNVEQLRALISNDPMMRAIRTDEQTLTYMDDHNFIFWQFFRMPNHRYMAACMRLVPVENGGYRKSVSVDCNGDRSGFCRARAAHLRRAKF